MNLLSKVEKSFETVKNTPSKEFKIISFHDFKSLSKITSKSDADTIGGDTTYELRYNMMDESCKLNYKISDCRGHFRYEKEGLDRKPNHVCKIRV